MIEAVLNRFRGTGDIIKISEKYSITGTHLYASYIGLVIGLFSTWYFGVLGAIAFIVGESIG